jgi:hypothetical protein
MTTYLSVDRTTFAIFSSVIGGLFVTFIWTEVSHQLLKYFFPQFSGNDRSKVIGPTVGMVERLLLTILTIWLPQALGPIAAAVIAAKVVLGWGDLGGSTTGRPGRTRYSVSLMNSLVSIIWAIGCGIWATH